MAAPAKDAPAKAAPARRTREKATWTVYQQVTVQEASEPNKMFDVGTVILVQIASNVISRRAADACWQVAELQLSDQATSDDPPLLTASRNGTGYGLSEARPYALRQTVARVK